MPAELSDTVAPALRRNAGRCRRLSFLLLFFLLVSLNACVPKKNWTDPALDRKAAARVNAAREFNAHITSSKGTGRLEITTGNRKEIYKIAWAAQAPNRLRLTLLLSGHPVETIAATGDWVTFISHTGKHNRHSAVSADPDLAPYIGVPVRLSEMIAMLLGRIPVRPFDRAWFSPDGTGRVYTARNFTPELQEIRQDSRGRVSELRLLDREKRLIFGAVFDDFTDGQDVVFARSLVLYDSLGRTIRITLPGLVPNAPVKESVFRLTAPGS